MEHSKVFGICQWVNLYKMLAVYSGLHSSLVPCLSGKLHLNSLPLCILVEKKCANEQEVVSAFQNKFVYKICEKT